MTNITWNLPRTPGVYVTKPSPETDVPRRSLRQRAWSGVNAVKALHDLPARRAARALSEAYRMALVKHLGTRVLRWLMVVSSIVLMYIGDLNSSASYGAHRTAQAPRPLRGPHGEVLP